SRVGAVPHCPPICLLFCRLPWCCGCTLPAQRTSNAQSHHHIYSQDPLLPPRSFQKQFSQIALTFTHFSLSYNS
ncbi:hypothetical protein K438DRAFT_1848051, partial [Mycena galopus ATCC 62051]